MAMYKNGNLDTSSRLPSISEFRIIIEKYGAFSEEANRYLSEFLHDETFCRIAEATRNSFVKLGESNGGN